MLNAALLGVAVLPAASFAATVARYGPGRRARRPMRPHSEPRASHGGERTRHGDPRRPLLAKRRVRSRSGRLRRVTRLEAERGVPVES